MELLLGLVVLLAIALISIPMYAIRGKKMDRQVRVNDKYCSSLYVSKDLRTFHKTVFWQGSDADDLRDI